jgi:two-component sensor histidine kinase
VLTALILVVVRIALVPVAGDRAPYAFVFLSVVLACVAAGWRSGLIALALGQLLAWKLIVGTVSNGVPHSDRIGGLITATVSQLIVLLIITLYQREVDKGTRDREARLTLLNDALNEIDHRTRNNYQTVLAMIDLQSRRATDPTISEALRQVSDRIQAIANASQQLAARSADLDAVRLDDHLCGLVQQIERGLSRDGIEVECEVDHITANADTATSISIIVNELVTNAIKHAFNGERSGHVTVTGRVGRGFELIVADNGKGIESTRRKGQSGLGTKLVESFARQLGARHEIVSSDKGTTHRLTIPRLA